MARPTASTCSTSWTKRGATRWHWASARNWAASAAATTAWTPPPALPALLRASPLDISRSNLWGLAHSLSLRTRVSTLEQRALLNYTWPHFLDNDKLSLSFTGLFDNSKDIRTYNYTRIEGSAQLSQRFTKSITLFYRLAYRRVSVADLKVTPFLISQLSQPVRVGIVSINLVQDRRDDPVDPHRGVYNTVDLGLAEHAFGSQRNFTRLLVRNASYYPLGKRLVLARSTEIGDMYSFHYNGSPLDAIPLAERFFGGGDTHRGFPEYQAGPRDGTTGFPIGGNALLFNQTELRFPLIGDNVGGVLYHDMGNVYSSFDNISFRVPSEQPPGFRLHGARGGLWNPLPHAGGPAPPGPGNQPQSALLPRLQGDPARVAERGRKPLPRAGRRAVPVHGAEREPFSILLFHRTDVLRLALSIALLVLAAGLQAEIIDRIAVSVGTQAITTSDIDREIRVTAFLNRTQPDFSPAARRSTADRLVEQRLILRELENSRYSSPAASELDPVFEQFKKDNFTGDDEYRRALAGRGITEQDVRDELLWQRRLLAFIDVRFRPAVQVSDQEIQDYFTKVVEPAAQAAHPGEPVSLDEYRDRIVEKLTGEQVDRQMSDWLRAHAPPLRSGVPSGGLPVSRGRKWAACDSGSSGSACFCSRPPPSWWCKASGFTTACALASWKPWRRPPAGGWRSALSGSTGIACAPKSTTSRSTAPSPRTSLRCCAPNRWPSDSSIVSILKRNVDIAYLDVIAPHVYLIVGPDGRTNIPEPKVAKKSGKPAVQTILDLAIGRFSLERGAVRSGIPRQDSVFRQRHKSECAFPLRPRRPALSRRHFHSAARSRAGQSTVPCPSGLPPRSPSKPIALP